MASFPVISLRNIVKSYTLGGLQQTVLKNISLDIYPGDLTAISGASGSGKSTLMHIIGLLDTDYSGTYTLKQQDIHTLSLDNLAHLRNKALGFVFQQFHLLPRFTALQNVMLPLTYRNMTRKEAEEAAFLALQSVHMHTFSHHQPGQLSGGQQQRVAIARALVTQPDIILADEPTGALDVKTSQEIMELLNELHHQKKTILIITHDPHIARLCKQQIVLSDGKIMEEIPA